MIRRIVSLIPTVPLNFMFDQTTFTKQSSMHIHMHFETSATQTYLFAKEMPQINTIPIKTTPMLQLRYTQSFKTASAIVPMFTLRGSISINPMLGATKASRPTSVSLYANIQYNDSKACVGFRCRGAVVKIGRIDQSRLLPTTFIPKHRRPPQWGPRKTYFPKGLRLKINILRWDPSVPSNDQARNIEMSEMERCQKCFPNCQPINLINLSPRSNDPLAVLG